MPSVSVEDQFLEILEALSSPPTFAEHQDGWTQESKDAAYRYFVELNAAVTSGSALPPLGIVRGLDHWGVTGGDLLESIARITNILRKRHAAQ